MITGEAQQVADAVAAELRIDEVFAEVLASDDPRGVVSVVTLSLAGYRKMVQNLAWAAGYNVLAIPLAAGVLAPWGISLPPAVGALVMSLSTIVVALNAQLLRGLDLRPGPQASGRSRVGPARGERCSPKGQQSTEPFMESRGRNGGACRVNR